MHRTRLDDSECPVARSLDMIGEWWSLLIIRDALRGLRRFEEFQESLGIARNMLSRRLKALVAAGILEKRAYVARPPRYDYQLTAKGEELLPVVVNLHLWGNRWAVPAAGPAMLLVDRTSGRADRAGPVAFGPADRERRHPTRSRPRRRTGDARDLRPPAQRREAEAGIRLSLPSISASFTSPRIEPKKATTALSNPRETFCGCMARFSYFFKGNR